MDTVAIRGLTPSLPRWSMVHVHVPVIARYRVAYGPASTGASRYAPATLFYRQAMRMAPHEGTAKRSPPVFVTSWRMTPPRHALLGRAFCKRAKVAWLTDSYLDVSYYYTLRYLCAYPPHDLFS